MPETTATPPMLAIVGKKHVGKTTLVARLCATLTNRGHRIMVLKHGSHTFNLDPAATDTYRHYHEGQAARVAMASPNTVITSDLARSAGCRCCLAIQVSTD